MDRRRILYRLCLVREFENSVLKLVKDGKIHGTCHACIGQETTALAVISQLENGDVITSTHRGHGHFLSRFGDAVSLAAEIMGRAGGVCGGWGGTQHLQAAEYYSNGITGGMLPNAVGMAFAEKRKDSGRIVAAFLGDGALGQGVVYESFNLASIWKAPIVFVLEDNGYAMSMPARRGIAGSMTARGEAFGLGVAAVSADDWDTVYEAAGAVIDYARQNRPQLLVLHTYRFCGHSKSDDGSYRPDGELERWMARDPLEKLAGELGDEAAGIKRRARDDVRDALAEAAGMPEAQLPEADVIAARDAHLGEAPGLPEMLENIVFAEPVEIPPESLPEPPAGKPEELFGRMISRAMEKLLAADERVYLIGEDVEDPYGGAFRLSRGFSTKYPGRVRNTPISEAGFVGLGAGMALRGLLPIIEIMFGDFVTLAFDQLVNHASKFRGMFGAKTSVPLVVRTPMGGRRGYGGTHSQTLEKHFSGLPGLKIIAPSAWHDPGTLLAAAVYDPNPVLFIENKLLYGVKVIAAGAEEESVFALRRGAGRYPVVEASTGEFEEASVTILAYGGMQPYVAEAAAALLEKEIYADLVLPSRVDAVEIGALEESLSRSGRLLVVEESVTDWGWGAEWLAALAENGRLGKIRVGRSGALRLPLPAGRSMEKQVLPGTNEIIRAVKKLLK